VPKRARAGGVQTKDAVARWDYAPCDVALGVYAKVSGVGSQDPPEHGRPMRLGWAKLLKRVFDLDLTRCPHCEGDLRIVAAILQRQAIEKILNHLGLDPQPPPRAPARGQMAF
jgi:hypothetical protein